MSQALPNINQKHTVKVNEGSGVLIQPMSADYAYVLTAKHCLKVNPGDLTSAFIKAHRVYFFEGTEIPVIDVICHDTKDMAILIIASKAEHKLMVNFDLLQVNDQLMLCGFPEDRRETDNEYSAFQYRFSYQSGDRLILSSEVPGVVHSSVVGFSGGGLFTLGLQGRPILLCAIETKMDGDVGKEYHGNISAIPISEFEQLIGDPSKSYLNKPLAPLLPLHLSNFEHLCKFSFEVSRGWANDDGLTLVQGCLRNTATQGIKVNLYPHELLVKFEKMLKVHRRPKSESRSRGLWVSLLELLTVSILVDKPEVVDIEYVESMLGSRRLMYIGKSGVWREYLSDILQSGLETLNQDGIIVVKTLGKFHEPLSDKVFLNKVWKRKNIGRPISDPTKITNANRSLSKIHCIIDLAALHNTCIEANEDVYEELINIEEFDEKKEAQILTTLAKEYGAYLIIEDSIDDI
jgi:hypothetical protein